MNYNKKKNLSTMDCDLLLQPTDTHTYAPPTVPSPRGVRYQGPAGRDYHAKRKAEGRGSTAHVNIMIK